MLGTVLLRRSGDGLGNFTPFYFTSQPYSAQGLDALDSFGSVQAAEILTQQIVLAPDQYEYTAEPGDIISFQQIFFIDQEFNDPSDPFTDESVVADAEVLSGSLSSQPPPVFINQEFNDESDPFTDETVVADAEILSGDVVQTYFPVNYVDWPEETEDFDLVADITGGTLV